MSAYVLLEDGTRFAGEACGAEGHATGEVVFTTGMAGYQESVTDPSFAGQLITSRTRMVPAAPPALRRASRSAL